ncbi:FecR family protein [Dysgonomonas termitidis]|uniref:FecR family protein n=1 Tax=Dysgonomonas termitidis TaxID=1516126 RepID=A0ABV9KVL1_9BACT
MNKANNRKKQLHLEYLRTLLRTERIFEHFTKGKLDRTNEKLVEDWNPEDTTEYYSGNEDLLTVGRKQVKDNIFTALGIHNPDKTIKKTEQLIFLRKYVAIAAILVVALLSGIYARYQLSDQKNNILAGMNPKSLLCQTDGYEIKQITLADGTILHANRNSRILFIEREYNLSKREIWIEDGEAFFEVAKNPEKPFIIHSGDIQTTVKGTSFNVKAYKGIRKNEVSVRSGKVEVICGDKKIGTLIANQQITYDTQTGEFNESSGNWQDAAAWMQNRLVLKQANVDELRLRLKQIYGVDMVITGGILDQNHFNASYPRDAQIGNVLQNISEVYDVKYKFENPQRVIIYK